MSLIPPAGPGGSESARKIVAMMESITGEAMHIGSPELALLARAAGGAARRYLETSNDAALVSCARTLRTLTRTVEGLVVPAAPAASSSAVATAEPSALERIRILIVDDSPLNVALMREALLSHGFDASAVGDDYALVLQRLTELRPHVLLVDWLMPGCDTRKLCRHILDTPELSQIRVILITSIPQREAAVLAASMKIAGALSKENGISAVVDYVRAVLKEPR